MYVGQVDFLKKKNGAARQLLHTGPLNVYTVDVSPIANTLTQDFIDHENDQQPLSQRQYNDAFTALSSTLDSFFFCLNTVASNKPKESSI